MDAPTVFLVAAAVIFIGFAGARLFQATRFPDIPVILAIGLLAGPLNRAAVAAGGGIHSLASSLSAPNMAAIAPVVSATALVVILFDSGLKLDFGQFHRSLRPALAHTLPTFVLTVLAIAAAARLLFGMPTIVAVVLGVALSNVGQTVSAAVLRDIRLDPETRAIYFAEMAMYDLVSIPILISLLEFAEGADPTSAGGWLSFLLRFGQLMGVSLAVGLGLGFAWAWALTRIPGHPYAYMLTFAALMTTFAVNRILGGSGAVSVLLFGLVLGNRHRLLGRAADDADMHRFHDEITFFVRTFFFLFLGISFTTTVPGAWPVDSPLLPGLAHTAALFLIGVLAVFGAIVGARWLSVRLVSARLRPHRGDLFLVFGRGLGTAVLATLPFLSHRYVPGSPYHALFAPWQPVFLNTALLVILFSVLASGFFVWRRELSGRRDASTTPAPQTPAPVPSARGPRRRARSPR